MQKFWKNNKGIIVFLLLMLFFRSAVADWYHVPSGSMQPNILIGDRVLVNKLAFDIKIPLTQINLNRHNEPERGDVVVFQSKQAEDRLIKRVIGLPGDSVSMLNNRLKINEKWVDTKPLAPNQPFDQFMQDRTAAYYQQELIKSISDSAANSIYPIRLSSMNKSRLSNFEEVLIPDDYLLVLGDNRDNSADSRVIGLVPRAELVGKAERVIVSFDRENYYLPRNARYWKLL